MAFEDFEFSNQEGKPVFLIHLFRGQGDGSNASKNWYYTNVDQNITFGGQTYEALPIGLSTIAQSGDAKSDSFQITLPASADICVTLDLGTPTEAISGRIRKVHMMEGTGGSLGVAPSITIENAPMIWVGEIVGFRRPSLTSRVLDCNTISLTMARGGLRLTWSRTCPHFLYDTQCRFNKADKALALPVVTVVNGTTIDCAALGGREARYWDAGFIEWFSSPGVLERTGIQYCVGTQAVLFGNTTGMTTGTGFIAYPGCDRTPTTCSTKFNNMLNYGGINHMQGRSPYDGHPVFN